MYRTESGDEIGHEVNCHRLRTGDADATLDPRVVPQNLEPEGIDLGLDLFGVQQGSRAARPASVGTYALSMLSKNRMFVFSSMAVMFQNTVLWVFPSARGTRQATFTRDG